MMVVLRLVRWFLVTVQAWSREIDERARRRVEEEMKEVAGLEGLELDDLGG